MGEDFYKWNKEDEKDRKSMIKFAETFGKFMSVSFADPKTKKGVVNTEKMFKAIKGSGEMVAKVLQSFLLAGSGSDIFKSVVNKYTDYLSLTFWGEIMESIDWDSINSAVTESIAPAFESLGEAVGDLLEIPAVQNVITDAVGIFAFGVESIAALLSGDMTGLQELGESVGWLMDVRDWWHYDVLGKERPEEIIDPREDSLLYGDIDLATALIDALAPDEVEYKPLDERIGGVQEYEAGYYTPMGARKVQYTEDDVLSLRTIELQEQQLDASLETNTKLETLNRFMEYQDR